MTTDYDKKRELEVRRPKSWCKSVCAFANGNGGSLIFGISKFLKVPQSSPKFPKFSDSLLYVIKIMKKFPEGTISLFAEEVNVSDRMIKIYHGT